MDWLNQAKRFLGNLFGGAQRTIGQISSNVARTVGQAEQQAARTAQQAIRQIPQAPRIQLPKVNIQPPKVQLPKVDFNAVGKALSDYYGKTELSKSIPKIKDVFDANSQLDIQKRLAAGQPADYRTQQIELFQKSGGKEGSLRPYQNIGAAAAGNTARFANTFAAAGRETNDTINIAILQALGQHKLANTLMDRNAEFKKQMYQPFSGLLGQGTIFNKPEEFGKLSTAELGTRIGAVTAGTALEVAPFAKGAGFASSAAYKALTPAQQVIARTAAGAVENALQDVAEQKFTYGGKWRPEQTAAAGVLGSIMPNVGPVVSRVKGAVTAKVAGAVPSVQATRVGQVLPTNKNAPITVGTLPEKGALRAQGYTNVNVQFTPQPGQVAPTMRGAIPQVAPKAPRIDITSPEAQSLKPTNIAINKLKSIAGDRQLAMEDFKAGRYSMTDLPVLVKKEKNGTLTVLDGNGRIIAAQQAGQTNIPVTTNEKLYREILTAREQGILPVKPIYETVPESAMRPKAPKGESTLADIQISTKPTKPVQPVSNKALEVKSQFLNRFDPIERFVRNVELERGTKLKPSENPMYYVKQFMGSGGIANYRIDNELTPMLKQTKNFDGLRQYLVARRMNELAERGIGKKANTAIAELTQKYGPDEIANFDKISTQLYAYQRNQLDQLLATGVISKQSYDNIIAKNQFYIPFNRVIPDVIADTTQSGQKISGAKKLASLKAIKGSEKEIIDPIESIIKNTYDVQATVAKQKVLNSLVALAPDEFKPLAKGAGLKAPAIELFSNGKRIKLSADPQLAKALNAMDEEQLNLVVRAMSLPAKTLRAGATSLNVAFALPNVLRDQLSAAVNSKYGGIPMYDFISGLSSVLKKDDSYKKWILSGADQATLFSQDRTTLMRGVKDITGGVGYKAGKLVKSPLELFRIFGDLSEKGSRLGVFKRALKGATKEGLKPEDALLTAMRESREATIDFAQRGSKMKAFNAMVPFLNARVQGTYKLAQSFKQRPVQTMMRGAAIASVPAAILYIHNNADGNKQIYSEIPDYIKRENFIIVTGDKNTPFIKIPKGEVGKIFANPVESFMAQINKDSTNWTETAKSIADSFIPIGSVSEPSRFLTDVIPTAIGVPLQVATNYDIFRGQNIVGQYQKDLPAAQQYNRYNTETAKKLGELLNISPAQLEFVLGGYTGGLGRQGLQVADITQGKVPAIQELPVLSRFLGEQKDLSASAQEIYKQAEKAKQEKARENFAIKKALEKGDTSVLEGLDKTTATRLKRSVAEEQAKKDLSPVQKALFDLPTAQLEALKQTGQYSQDIVAIEDIKNKINESLAKPKTAKVTKPKISKVRKGRAGRTTAKRVSLKAPRVRRIKVAAPKGTRKISFKVPTPKTARKSIKIKTG